jgi:antitoxin MazE
MRVTIVRIGNSRGIRIPKALIDQYELGDAVELEAHEDHLAIRPARTARFGWDEAFREMAEQGDDELLDRGSLGQTEWEKTEWEW